MHAENPIVDQCCNRKAIEDINERLPKFDRVSTFTCISHHITFVKEPIKLGDFLALMVAPQHEEVFRVFNFIASQEAESFDSLFSPIDVIAQKHVVGCGRLPAKAEYPQQVVILAVYVA